MGRKLTGQIERTPLVNIRDKKNSYLVASYLGNRREVRMKKGKGYVHEFALEDTDCMISLKNDAGTYDEVKEIQKGAKVSTFAPTVLDGALQKAKVGERLRITYLGLEQGKKGGSDYHNFDVEVL